MSPIEFLTDIFGDAVGPDRQVVIFGISGPNRSINTSRWCPTLDAATRAVEELGALGDVYFGCSLQDPRAALTEARRRARDDGRPEPSDLTWSRGYSVSACAIGGLWLDIDVAGFDHNGTRLPPSLDAALGVLDALPHRATLTLNSGGGLHPWWLFKEPWTFASERERVEAARLVHGWQSVARALANAHGWTLDSTHDLARVLRLPGTINRKYGRAVEVVR